MSGINWKKDADRRRMQRQVVEGNAVPSKDALRRQADALLAGYTGPVKKVPAGAHVIGSQVSAEIRRQSSCGNVARSVTGNASSKVAKRKHNRPFYSNANPHRSTNELHNRAVPPGLVIYCDGACEPNPGAGGWGFVVYENGVEVHFDCGGADPTTNNVMELTGALRALEWYAEFGTKPIGVHLFCDSMYVVNGCNDWRHGWKARGWRRKGKNPEIANLDIWKELDAALTAVPIQLEWCKGHAGIVGNERADGLSLEGRQSILAIEGHGADLIREQLDYSARGGV